MQQILMHHRYRACRELHGDAHHHHPRGMHRSVDHPTYCFGINMHGRLPWLGAALADHVPQPHGVHNLFTPSCVGWGTGNFGPERNGEPISDEFSRNVWLP
jgi:hypothetical protein